MTNRLYPVALVILLLASVAAAPAQQVDVDVDAGGDLAQTALLEATRQDMVTYRLSQLSAQFRYLMRDLESNAVDNPQLKQDLADLSGRVQALQDQWVEQVKANLTAVADGSPDAPRRVAEIRRDIRRIVRELAVLLLEAGVRHATEVAATRIDDIVDRQQALIDSTPGAADAAPAQRELAGELDELLGELRTLVNPMANPLAAVRLARVHKMIAFEQATDRMEQAAEALADGDREAARAHQDHVLAALRQARQKLRPRDEGQGREELRARRLAASRRVERLRVHQDRQLDFVTEAADTPADDPAFERLLENQRRQLEDIEELSRMLPENDRWTPAVRAAVDRAARGLGASLLAFENGDADNAMRESRAVIGALRVAADRLERKVEVLEHIDGHLSLADDMRYVSDFLNDIEQEQADLDGRAPTEPPTRRTQGVVAGALGELQNSVEGLAEAASVSQPMREAEAAMSSLAGTGELDAAQAEGLRTEARQRTQTARERAGAVAARADYIAEWLEYLGRQQADLLSLLARQVELRERTERESERMFGELTGEQDILLAETQAYAGAMEIGQEHYARAAGEMELAMGRLKDTDREQAVYHQRRAEDALRAAAKALADMLNKLAEITTLERMAFYEAEVHILSKVLMLAVEQRHIRFRTAKATVDEMGKFTSREQEHLRRLTLALTADVRTAALPGLSEGLDRAADAMSDAVTALNQGRRDQAIGHQQQAEKILRRFIAELTALILQINENVPPEAQGGGGDGWMVNTSMPMESVRIFGEAPIAPHQGAQVGPSTWEPLNARERAALSENFARELPLEYRTMLKAYYRSLAR